MRQKLVDDNEEVSTKLEPDGHTEKRTRVDKRKGVRTEFTYDTEGSANEEKQEFNMSSGAPLGPKVLVKKKEDAEGKVTHVQPLNNIHVYHIKFTIFNTIYPSNTLYTSPTVCGR